MVNWPNNGLKSPKPPFLPEVSIIDFKISPPILTGLSQTGSTTFTLNISDHLSNLGLVRIILADPITTGLVSCTHLSYISFGFSSVISNPENTKDELIEYCIEYLKINKKLDILKDKEIELEGLKIHNRQTIDKLLKDNEKTLPLTINMGDFLIIITDEKIFIEKNVI